jgi:hypothetical protein
MATIIPIEILFKISNYLKLNKENKLIFINKEMYELVKPKINANRIIIKFMKGYIYSLKSELIRYPYMSQRLYCLIYESVIWSWLYNHEKGLQHQIRYWLSFLINKLRIFNILEDNIEEKINNLRLKESNIKRSEFKDLIFNINSENLGIVGI